MDSVEVRSSSEDSFRLRFLRSDFFLFANPGMRTGRDPFADKAFAINTGKNQE
jgi:hypothetical protein